MKRVLITGERSYVGTQLKQWLVQWPEEYYVTMISVRDQQWRQSDFSKFDVVVHAAALVHTKEKPSMRDEYFRVNSDLTYDLAVKAKQEGISQFIFLSTISVYGLDGEIGKPVVINRDTPLKPKSYYGMSKLDAENRIQFLQDESFVVSYLRVPMIYGPNCPGNYAKLRKLVLKLPIFPLIENQRSMIFSDHLSEFIRVLMNNRFEGLFFPQNRYFTDTMGIVNIYCQIKSKRIKPSKLAGKLIIYFMKNNISMKKLFGNLIVDQELSEIHTEYSLYSLLETIIRSE